MNIVQKLMRSSLGLTLAIFFVSGIGISHAAHTALPQKAKDVLGLPESFSLASRKFVLASVDVVHKETATHGGASNPSGEGIVQIYVPEHEDFLQASDRIAVHATSGLPARAAIRSFIEKIGKEHQTDPYQILFGLYVSNDHKEDMLGESTLFDTIGGQAFLEWGASRFSPFTLKDGRSGVVQYSVSHRVYGTDERADAEGIREFIRSPQRREWEDFVGSRESLPLITQMP